MGEYHRARVPMSSKHAHSLLWRVLDLLLPVATVLLPASIAMAGTTADSRQAQEMRMLQDAAVRYRRVVGAYPTPDAAGSWFEELASAKFIYVHDVRSKEIDGTWLPLDQYGQPYVYELPQGRLGDPLDTDTWPILRSVGRDGRDDLGGHDDWDIRFGPNWGHWHKRRYPLATVVAGIGVLASGGLVLLAKPLRWRVVAATTGLGVTLILIPVIAVYSRPGPAWFAGLSVIGSGLLLFAGGMLGWITFSKIMSTRRTRSRLSEGQCVRCGYPLVRSASMRCPECGAGPPERQRMLGGR